MYMYKIKHQKCFFQGIKQPEFAADEHGSVGRDVCVCVCVCVCVLCVCANMVSSSTQRKAIPWLT